MQCTSKQQKFLLHNCCFWLFCFQKAPWVCTEMISRSAEWYSKVPRLTESDSGRNLKTLWENVFGHHSNSLDQESRADFQGQLQGSSHQVHCYLWHCRRISPGDSPGVSWQLQDTAGEETELPEILSTQDPIRDEADECVCNPFNQKNNTHSCPQHDTSLWDVKNGTIRGCCNKKVTQYRTFIQKRSIGALAPLPKKLAICDDQISLSRWLDLDSPQKHTSSSVYEDVSRGN